MNCEPKLTLVLPNIGRKFYKIVRKRRKRTSTRRESKYDRGQFTTEGDRDAADDLVRDDYEHRSSRRKRDLYPERRREGGDREIRVEPLRERPPPRRVEEDDEIVVIEEPDSGDDRRRNRARSRVGSRIVDEAEEDERVFITEEARREDRKRYSEKMNERFRDEGYVEGAGERYRSRE